MIEGQILEFENNFNYRLSTADLLRHHTPENLLHVRGDCPAGRPLAGAAGAGFAEFYRFGQDFGMIFQISDDLLDIFSERSGKSRFQDLREGKVTLPYILLLRHGALPLIKDFDRAGPLPLLELCRSQGIKEQALRIIDRYHGRCSSFLSSFPPSLHRESLGNLLEFIRYREY